MGGNGQDTFVYQASDGSDTIFDFQRGVDRLDISALILGGGGTYDFGDVGITNDPNVFAARGITEVAVIDFSAITGNGTDMILLPNVDASLISRADFVL